jgi:hypothetical protein
MPGMAWFRVNIDILDDPRFHEMSPALFRTWVFLLALGRKDDGKLPDAGKIAFALRLSEEQATRDIEQLIGLGLIERTPTGFTPHNWERWQYEFPSWKPSARAEQKAKERARGDVASDVATVSQAGRKTDKNRTEKIREEETETREEPTPQPPKRGGLSGANDSAMKKSRNTIEEDECRRWLALYPEHRRDAIEIALSAWREATDKPSVDEMIATLGLQRASVDWTKEDKKYVPRSAKYLRERTWTRTYSSAPPKVNRLPSPDIPAPGKAIY